MENKFLIKCYALVLIIGISGCATTQETKVRMTENGIVVTEPEKEKISTIDNYGEYPDNYKEIVKDYYSQRLIDPYSARYRWITQPYRGYFPFGKLKFGWIVEVGINAKNRFGGYVGEKEEAFLIKNGRVINSLPSWMLED